MTYQEKDCEACERCGSFIPKDLVMYHQCQGSDMSKRPANVPLARWLQLQKSAADELRMIGTLFRAARGEPMDDDPTVVYQAATPTPRPTPTPGVPKPKQAPKKKKAVETPSMIFEKSRDYTLVLFGLAIGLSVSLVVYMVWGR